MKSNKMPLLLYGARQVGKTYVIMDFGKRNYKNVVYVNFEEDRNIINYFNDSIAPNRIIDILIEYYHTEILKKETLVIFDEIQSCNRALTSLKYFAEQEPEYDIIAAGSLLGVAINSKEFSFPVGKVITKTLYPLDFEEFLIAKNKNILLNKIKECFENNTAINEGLHNEALLLYKEYLLVGGMPMAVKSYIDDNKDLGYKEIQRIIIDTYTSDMTKYTDKSQSIKTIATYESIIPQLAKDNKKFQYSVIQKGARASLFGESIDWLLRAGIVYKCNKISRGDAPPSVYADMASFKLYMSDIRTF